MTGRRAYDHRLRERIHRNEPVPGLRQLRIPRSTRSSWRCREPRAVVTLDAVDQDRQQLLDRIDRLQRRVALLTPVVRLAFAIVRVSGFQLSGERLPQGDTKRAVLDAIGTAVRLLPLAVVLRSSASLPRATTPGAAPLPRAGSMIDLPARTCRRSSFAPSRPPRSRTWCSTRRCATCHCAP